VTTMKRYGYITVIALAVLALAIGGWIARPTTILRPRHA
jgi:hypothetical protein